MTRQLVFYNDSANGTHTYVSGEDLIYGDLFQWGRIADGHQTRTSTAIPYTGITVSEIGNGLRCGVGGISYPQQQIKESSNWYGKFISGNTTWTPADQSTANQLWQAGRFRPNDPCAHYKEDGTYSAFWNSTDQSNTTDACIDPYTNWRIPTQAEWGEIYRGGTLSGSNTIATANSWKWVNCETTKDQLGKRKYQFAGGFQIQPDNATTTFFLPASGRRNSNGVLADQGNSTGYWSSTITGNDAYYLTFGPSSVTPAYILSRAYGFALRCIKNS
jgi:uncharacterized protein (TIGR02145 family)